jgi:hypothetical protein
MRSIMIGSQRHEEMAAAIRKHGVNENPEGEATGSHWR